jgi:hypothetical protein
MAGHALGASRRVELFQQVEELKAYLAGQATALEEVNAELHELGIRVGIPSTRPMGAESAINVDWINADLLCAKSGRNERVGTVMNAYYYKIMEALRGDLAALIKAYQGAK